MNSDEETRAGGPPDDADRLLIRSEDLLQGRSEVYIQHGDETYCLRLTPTGKLYLTK